MGNGDSAIVRAAENAAEIAARLLVPVERPETVAALRRFQQDLDSSFAARPYYDLPVEARARWTQLTAPFDAAGRAAAARWLLAACAAGVPRRLSDAPVPESIHSRIASELNRVMSGLNARRPQHLELDNDVYLKDLGICRLRLFPCAAQVLDPHAGISRSLVLARFTQAAPQLIGLAIGSRLRFAPFLEAHTHTPLLKDFTPRGWLECYRLAADLLESNPRLQGLISGSWFFDPALEAISPDLAYLRQTPKSGGAFFLRIGGSESDIANATATSPTRRKLHESGQYQPTAYLMVWPRGNLVAWARRHAAGV